MSWHYVAARQIFDDDDVQFTVRELHEEYGYSATPRPAIGETLEGLVANLGLMAADIQKYPVLELGKWSSDQDSTPRDPAVDAVERALDEMFGQGYVARSLNHIVRHAAELAAREALKPLRAVVDEWKRMDAATAHHPGVLSMPMRDVIARLEPLIYPEDQR